MRGNDEWGLMGRMTTTTADRIVTLDVIRGVAVMGIFSVNVTDFAMIQAAYSNPLAYGGSSGENLLVWALNMLFVDGKFRTLFSCLFGASMLLVIERAGAAGWSVHWRRMAVLLLFGLAHAILLWRGDILALYAVTGTVAYFCHRMSTIRLVALGGALSMTNLLLFGAIAVTLYHQDVVAHGPNPSALIVSNRDANFGSFFPSAQQIAADLKIYDGSWPAIVAHEAAQAGQIFVNILTLLPDTLGLMLLGMAAYKSGFATGAWSGRSYRRIAAWGIGIGLAGFAGLVAAELASGFYVPILIGGFLAAMVPFRIVMAAGYVALLVLLFRNRSSLRDRLAAVGRAAFSNYLGTSLVATSVFYGWGLGWYGDVSRAEAWLLVPLVWLAMLAWSKPWLDRFAYGPLEWLWRSLARWEMQPFRKRPGEPAAAGV